MNVLLTPLGDLDARDVEAWRALAAAPLEPNPFNEPEFVLPLARHVAPGEPVGMLRVVDGERWRACLPVVKARAWHRLPIGALTAWAAPEHHYVPTPLIGRDGAQASAGALLDGLRGQPGVGLASFFEHPEGPALRALESALRQRGGAPLRLDPGERAVVRRRAEPTYLDERVKGKHRAELRRLRRRLGEEAGGAVEVLDRGEDAGAVERFMALEAAGWKGERGQPVASDPGVSAFFRAMTAGFAADGRLHVVSSDAGDQTLATAVLLRAGDALFLLRITYDERYARHSPGRLLMADLVEFFHHETSCALLDSCANPFNALFNGLYPDRLAVSTLVIPARGPRGRLAGSLVQRAWPLRARAQSLRRARKGAG